MKKWDKLKNIGKGHLAAAVTTVVAISTGMAVLANASGLDSMFEPRDFERFENFYNDGDEYDSVAGEGEESDLADEDADGRDSADKDTQKAMRMEEDESGDRNSLGLAESGENGDGGQEENPDAFELTNEQGRGTIDIRPADANYVNDGNGGGDGSSDGGNLNNAGQTAGGSAGGTGDAGVTNKPDAEVKPDVPDEPEEPTPDYWSEEQLKPRDPVYVDGYGELIGLSAVFTETGKYFYQGEAFKAEDAEVTATFVKDGVRSYLKLSYGGGNGYSILISTASRGTHTATFRYRGFTASAQYEVTRAGVNVRYYGEQPGKDGINIYAVNTTLEGVESSGRQSLSATKYPGSDGRVDLTLYHKQMIADLGNPKHREALEKAFVVCLNEDKNGYLETMLYGFQKYENGKLTGEDSYYVHFPVKESETANFSVMDVVKEVPEGYKIIREVSKDKPNAGEQVLVGYEGTDTVLDVPPGVTSIRLKQENTNVTALILPDSVDSIDFESIAECLPNLKEYRTREDSAGQSEVSSFMTADGILYSKDGETLIRVPVGKEKIIIPEAVTVLAEGSLSGLKAVEGNTIRIKGTLKEAEGAWEKAEGDEYGETVWTVLFQDSEYDIALKSGMFAFKNVETEGAGAVKFGVMDENNNEIAGSTERYQYDARNILMVKGNKNILAGIPVDTNGYYTVPGGITAIGGGAFAGIDGLREIKLTGEVTSLQAGSLAGMTNVKNIHLSADFVEIVPEIFGDSDKVPEITVYVPGDAYDAYLEEWSDKLDSFYGAGTAAGLILPGDGSIEYIDEATYRKISVNGKERYRLLKVYKQNPTAFQAAANTAEIDEAAFEDCAQLEILYLPDTVTAAEAGALAECLKNCPKLETVIARNASKAAFEGISEQVKVYTNEFASYQYEKGIIYGRAGNGTCTLLNVPTDYAGTVTLIAGTNTLNEEAFKDCGAVKEVKNLKSVSKIGKRCFENCVGITELDFSGAAGLTEIAEGVFSGCIALEKLNAPNVKTIGNEAFSMCQSLSPGSIPWEKVTSMGDYAFSSCQEFESITLSEKLTGMGEGCFSECDSLKEIKLYGKLSGINRECFYGCGALSKVTFNAQQKNALKGIGAGAFEKCTALESLNLESFTELESIGTGAFADCSNLATVTLPKKISRIEVNCFRDCVNLSILTITCEEMAEFVVTESDGTKFDETVFGETLSPHLKIRVGSDELIEKYIAAYTEYFNTKYEADARDIFELIGKREVEYIRGIQFRFTEAGRVLEKVTDTFEGSYTVPADTVLISEGAFENCESLTGIVLPEDSSITLAAGCFKNCVNLKTVTLNGSIPEWGDDTFAGCTALETVLIGSSKDSVIPRVGTRAFSGCTGLSDRTTAVRMHGTISALGEGCFAGCTNLQAIASDSHVRPALTEIEDRAFENCESLTTFLTSAYGGLTTIGAYAFAGCDSLTGPSVPGEVTSIGEGCFQGCANLETVSIYGAVEEYPKNCFKDCPNLIRTGGTAKAQAALKRIGESAYEGCTSLTTVINPPAGGAPAWDLGIYTNLEEIGVNAFKGCESMTEIRLSDTVKNIRANAFSGCVGITKIELSDSLTAIGEGAFSGCTGITKIELPDKIVSIGGDAFSNMSALKELIFTSVTPPQIGQITLPLDAMPDFRIIVPDGEGIYEKYLEIFEGIFGEKAADIVRRKSDAAAPPKEEETTPGVSDNDMSGNDTVGSNADGNDVAESDADGKDAVESDVKGNDANGKDTVESVAKENGADGNDTDEKNSPMDNADGNAANGAVKETSNIPADTKEEENVSADGEKTEENAQ